MKAGSKTISNSLRPKIDSLKCIIRYTPNPFDGSGSVFKTAISELRKEGLKIVHDKEKCRYYNEKTISKSWGY